MALGDQRGIDLRLADLDDVEVHFRAREARELAAQLLDVGALLADQNAGARRVNGDAALLVRALDDDLGDAGLTALLHDVIAHAHVFVQQPAVLAAASEPAAVPGAVDAEAQADGIDFLTHYAVSLAAGLALLPFLAGAACFLAPPLASLAGLPAAAFDFFLAFGSPRLPPSGGR